MTTSAVPVFLQFITSDSFVSRAIRAVTWSQFSHVDLVVPSAIYYPSNGAMPDMLLGAQADGVKLRPRNYCKMTKCALVYANVTIEQSRTIYDFAMAQIGKPYDYTALMGNLLHRDWQEDDSWFCSELVAAAFAHAGVPLLRGNHSRITPGMLLQSPLLEAY